MDFKFLIITNYHVVEEAANETRLDDFKLDGNFSFQVSPAEETSIGRTSTSAKKCVLEARIVEYDKQKDLALLTLVFASNDAEAVQDFTGQ